MIVWNTVMRVVKVPVSFNKSKLNKRYGIQDEEYVQNKKTEITSKAAKWFGCSERELFISDSDVDDLID